MNKQNFSKALFAAILISNLFMLACSNNSDKKDDKQKAQGCPLTASMPAYAINISTKTLPGKTAVIHEGLLKFDECADNPILSKDAPLIIGKNINQKDGILSYRVAIRTYPQETSFEILDRGDCSSAPVSFLKVESLPVTVERTYPYGVDCGASVNAYLNIVK